MYDKMVKLEEKKNQNERDSLVAYQKNIQIRDKTNYKYYHACYYH